MNLNSSIKNRKWQTGWLWCGLLMLAVQSSINAQNYSIGWSRIAGGGGTSSGGQYDLAGTIGQYEAGRLMANGNYSANGGFWERPGGPWLTLRLTSPTTFLISWPAPALGCFVLQQTSSLTNPNWVDVPNAVTFVSGVNQVVLST